MPHALDTKVQRMIDTSVDDVSNKLMQLIQENLAEAEASEMLQDLAARLEMPIDLADSGDSNFQQFYDFEHRLHRLIYCALIGKLTMALSQSLVVRS